MLKKFIQLTLTIVTLLFANILNAQSCYELVWSDEFNYTGLPDSTNWTFEEGGDGWGNNELQYYTSKRLKNAHVDTGYLTIEAHQEEYGGRNYTSARLITYPNGHTFKYGRIEARMKLPYGQGIWPAFWMLGDNIFEGTSWPACGEIDIMELVGGGEGRDDVVHGTIHYDDNGNADYGGQYQLSEGIFADSFHTFSIEWTDAYIKWFVDGVQYHEASLSPSYLSELKKNFFILLNIAVGGNWPGNPNASTVFPQKMVIDYVRVYQMNSSLEIYGDSVVNRAQKNIKFQTAESEDYIYTWSVPADATIVDGQGTNSITVNWGCQAGDVTCEIVGNCDTYNPIFSVALEDIEILGDNNIEPNTTNKYWINELTASSYNWTVPEGVTFEGVQDTNVVTLNWGIEPGYVKVDATTQCGIEVDSLFVQVVSQLPYPDPNVPNAIPGAVQAVNYDYGGEGIAYHDSDAINQGTGSRQDEGVDTEVNDGGENIGWIKPGEWVEYTVAVDSSQLYNIEIRTASQSTGGELIIYINGEDRTGTITLPPTYSWTSFTSVDVEGIQLYDTDTLMRVEFVSGEFNVSRFIYSAEGVSINNGILNTMVIYPNPAQNFIYLKNQSHSLNYQIVDILGKTIESDVVMPDNSISVKQLDKGSYFLILYNENAAKTYRFIKQ